MIFVGSVCVTKHGHRNSRKRSRYLYRVSFLSLNDTPLFNNGDLETKLRRRDVPGINVCVVEVEILTGNLVNLLPYERHVKIDILFFSLIGITCVRYINDLYVIE